MSDRQPFPKPNQHGNFKLFDPLMRPTRLLGALAVQSRSEAPLTPFPSGVFLAVFSPHASFGTAIV